MGQSQLAKYINKGKIFEKIERFYVNEIIILSDSTYVNNLYKLQNKKQQKKYWESIPYTSGGKYKLKGEYYIFREKYQNFDNRGFYKKNETQLVFYYDWKNNKLKKGAVFKRTEQGN